MANDYVYAPELGGDGKVEFFDVYVADADAQAPEYWPKRRASAGVVNDNGTKRIVFEQTPGAPAGFGCSGVRQGTSNYVDITLIWTAQDPRMTTFFELERWRNDFDAGWVADPTTPNGSQNRNQSSITFTVTMDSGGTLVKWQARIYHKNLSLMSAWSGWDDTGWLGDL